MAHEPTRSVAAVIEEIRVRWRALGVTSTVDITCPETRAVKYQLRNTGALICTITGEEVKRPILLPRSDYDAVGEQLSAYLTSISQQ